MSRPLYLSKKSALLGLLLGLAGLSLAAYGLFLWAMNLLLTQPEADTLWHRLADQAYPRWRVELARLGHPFFAQKATQVGWRLGLSWLVLLLGMGLYRWHPAWPQQWRRYWAGHLSPQAAGCLRAWYWLVFGYCTYDWCWVLAKLESLRPFYSPTGILGLVQMPLPTTEWLWALCGLMYGAAIWAWVRPKAAIAASLAIVLFVLLQGWLYSFHKLDHTFALFTLLSYWILVGYWQPQWPVWGVRWMHLTVVWVYVSAGLEKILVGGWAWFQPETLQTYLRLHEQPLGLWLAQYPWLCSLMAVMAVGLELAFGLVLWRLRWRSWVVLGGILFHQSTYQLMGVGGLLSPWLLCYGCLWIPLPNQPAVIAPNGR
ncbi:hypothetical protein [Eisenibacter elegans]|jgi:hypothetical protein|uniref:hypothetical protein n=1 Tax=Eisenibacter elegans TaxID=997 RepID=UPI000417F1DD|nr:hypothetical protein [Eisenibacter elegans]